MTACQKMRELLKSGKIAKGKPVLTTLTDRVNVGATWNEVDTNLIAANLFSSTSSEETNDIRRQSQDDETKTNAYPDKLRFDANVDLDVARKRERWRHNSANYRARKRAAAAETPEELSQKRERWRRNSENYRDKKRAVAAETPEELSQKRERWRRNSENYRDKKRAAAAETPEELAQNRDRWRLNSEVFRTRNRTKHSDVRSRCVDPTSHPGALILESISTETRDAGMARLRQALGPDMLDEVGESCLPEEVCYK
ncbi:hypothetical protein PR001_g12843 [Phytophthora rubi]|uniref:Uncharacterized protein n=1 Tax=Phytophthora rubi TaxID=129364 RepID=A0A6A3LWR2_9STRA|nr:hypothetical protein PR001_g12843 [Phytophthora rubi]